MVPEGPLLQIPLPDWGAGCQGIVQRDVKDYRAQEHARDIDQAARKHRHRAGFTPTNEAGDSTYKTRQRCTKEKHHE